MTRLIFILCGLLPLLFVSCASERGVTGRAYRRELIKTIQKSDRIEVTEHSHFTDDTSLKYGRTIDEQEQRTPYYEYGRAELSAAAKEAFLKSVRELGTKQAEGGWRCIYQPHHTIRFYQAGELSSTMNVCFTCSQVGWHGDHYAYPVGLMKVLAATVESCGLKAEKDGFYWHEKFDRALKTHPNAPPKPRRPAVAGSADRSS